MGTHYSHFQKEERDQLEVLLKTGISNLSLTYLAKIDQQYIERLQNVNRLLPIHLPKRRRII
ncbi:MAG: hypothetical protein GY782_09500 [Gammaproteobacteria bacterium]|nr:hypothetical protein [Gammaproteobacteria bacterium]